MLEHETDLTIPGTMGKRVLAVERHFAGIRPIEPRDDPQQRGLAGTRRPQQCQQLAVGNPEVDAIERSKGTEFLHDGFQLNAHGMSALSSRRRSRMVFTTSVISASVASKEAIANDAAN